MFENFIFQGRTLAVQPDDFQLISRRLKKFPRWSERDAKNKATIFLYLLHTPSEYQYLSRRCQRAISMLSVCRGKGSLRRDWSMGVLWAMLGSESSSGDADDIKKSGNTINQKTTEISHIVHAQNVGSALISGKLQTPDFL